MKRRIASACALALGLAATAGSGTDRILPDGSGDFAIIQLTLLACDSSGPVTTIFVPVDETTVVASRGEISVRTFLERFLVLQGAEPPVQSGRHVLTGEVEL